MSTTTIVFQGLQSCLDPQVKETDTLRLKLAAPKSIGLENRGSSLLHSSNTREIIEKCHNENTTNQITSNLDLGGWSFLQNLSNSSQIPKNAEAVESSYVQPKAKSCPLRLSEKSLELCTENLGSETGSDTSESSIFSLSSWESRSEESAKWEEKIARQFSSKKKANSRSFPPPLTTISGSNSIQVRPQREGGKLIIKAVEAPSMRTCFEAERSHGRLKLRFLENCEFNYEQKVALEEIQEINGKYDKIVPFEDDQSNEENQEEYEDEEESGAYIMDKDTDGNSIDVEVEMGMEKFQRPSRCKEGGNGSDKGRLCNWEAFWVATSLDLLDVAS